MNTTSESNVTYWQLELSKSLKNYVAPVIFVVGSLGNLVCLVVLQTKPFRGTTHALLLSALAVCDLGVLNTGLLRFMLRSMLDYDPRHQSILACKFHYFLTYLFPQLSSWTLVLVTGERLVSLLMPLRIKVIITRCRVVIAWFVMAFVLAALNSPWLVIVNLTQITINPTNTSITVCWFTTDLTEYVYNNVITYLDLIVLSFLPTLIIIPCNGCIIRKVFRSNRAHAQVNRVNGTRNSNTRSVTVMLLVVSSVFILTTTPVTVYFVGVDIWPKNTELEKAKKTLAHTICNLLYNLNSAINFFLYCISGTHFRTALSSSIGCQPSKDLMYRARTGSLSTSMLTALITVNGPLTRNGSLIPQELHSTLLKHYKNRLHHNRLSLDDATSNDNTLKIIQAIRKAHSDSGLDVHKSKTSTA